MGIVPENIYTLSYKTSRGRGMILFYNPKKIGMTPKEFIQSSRDRNLSLWATRDGLKNIHSLVHHGCLVKVVIYDRHCKACGREEFYSSPCLCDLE